MIDPVALATITSAVSVLATEFTKGLSSDAGKDTWKKVKSIFGWTSEPNLSDLAPEVARKLQASPRLAQKIVELLQDNQSTETASQLVGRIDAEKVVVAHTIRTETFNM